MRFAEKTQYPVYIAGSRRTSTRKPTTKSSTKSSTRKSKKGEEDEVKVPNVQVVESTLTEAQLNMLSEHSHEIGNSRYDLDEHDAEWLETYASRQIKISWDVFEQVMEVLESASRENVLEFDAFVLKCTGVEHLALTLIYDYWLEKRKTVCCNTSYSASLIPAVPSSADRIEKDSPYIAFRSRDTPPPRRKSIYSSRKKITETAEKKKREYKEILQERISMNSELDGEFAFKRNRSSTYQPHEGFEYDENA